MLVLAHPKSSEAFRARLANRFGAVRTVTAADKISMVVCARWEHRTRPEALHASCADCGCEIAHMPHAPVGPPKVCHVCAVVRMRTVNS